MNKSLSYSESFLFIERAFLLRADTVDRSQFFFAWVPLFSDYTSDCLIGAMFISIFHFYTDGTQNSRENGPLIKEIRLFRNQPRRGKEEKSPRRGEEEPQSEAKGDHLPGDRPG